MTKKEYDDIPGTFVFDADRSREGYHLNQFCISLRLQKNRDDFNEDENKFEKIDNLKNQDINEMAVNDKPKILCINKFSSI